MASSNKKNNRHNRNNKIVSRTYSASKQTKQKTKKWIPIVIIFNFIILLIIIGMLIYNAVIMNENIKKINEEIEEMKNEQVQLETVSPHYVFLGDSITEQYDLSEYFNGYSVVNSGLAGDTVEGILKNMEERVYRYNPSAVFLMIGTNDVINGRTSEYVFKKIKKIVEEIQINLPNTRIVVEAITPSQENDSDTDKNETRREINKLLYNEYKDSNVVYMDLYSIFEDKDTKNLNDDYTKDGLHLNDKAYEIISKKQKEYMNVQNK